MPIPETTVVSEGKSKRNTAQNRDKLLLLLLLLLFRISSHAGVAYLWRAARYILLLLSFFDPPIPDDLTSLYYPSSCHMRFLSYESNLPVDVTYVIVRLIVFGLPNSFPRIFRIF